MRKTINFIQGYADLVCDICGSEYRIWDMDKAMKADHFCLNCEKREIRMNKIKKKGKVEIEKHYREIGMKMNKYKMSSCGDEWIDDKVQEVMKENGV